MVSVLTGEGGGDGARCMSVTWHNPSHRSEYVRIVSVLKWRDGKWRDGSERFKVCIYDMTWPITVFRLCKNGFSVKMERWERTVLGVCSWHDMTHGCVQGELEQWGSTDPGLPESRGMRGCRQATEQVGVLRAYLCFVMFQPGSCLTHLGGCSVIFKRSM